MAGKAHFPSHKPSKSEKWNPDTLYATSVEWKYNRPNFTVRSRERLEIKQE